MQGSKTKVDPQIRRALAGINRTAEGEVVRQYIAARHEALAYKALSCKKEEIEHIQGYARAYEEMLRDLQDDRSVDDNQS